MTNVMYNITTKFSIGFSKMLVHSLAFVYGLGFTSFSFHPIGMFLSIHFQIHSSPSSNLNNFLITPKGKNICFSHSIN